MIHTIKNRVICFYYRIFDPMALDRDLQSDVESSTSGIFHKSHHPPEIIFHWESHLFENLTQKHDIIEKMLGGFQDILGSKLASTNGLAMDCFHLVT